MPYLHWNTPDNQKHLGNALRLLGSQYKKKNNDLLDAYDEDRHRSVYPFDDDLPYHPTRTLDQYFCQNINTEILDSKQTCLAAEGRLLVVEQLWIMITNDGWPFNYSINHRIRLIDIVDVVVTAFPSRSTETADGESADPRSFSHNENIKNCTEGFMDLRKSNLHTKDCPCGFADIRKMVHTDLKRSGMLDLAYETPFSLAANIIYHTVCTLLGSKTRNGPKSLHVEATFRNKLADTVCGSRLTVNLLPLIIPRKFKLFNASRHSPKTPSPLSMFSISRKI
jgi:hypothetical protein